MKKQRGSRQTGDKYNKHRREDMEAAAGPARKGRDLDPGWLCLICFSMMPLVV
jgi:hypothetical protein